MFKQIVDACVTRMREWNSKGMDGWTVSDFAVELAGEAGELCDAVKKLRRHETGMQGGSKSLDELHKAISH